MMHVATRLVQSIGIHADTSLAGDQTMQVPQEIIESGGCGCILARDGTTAQVPPVLAARNIFARSSLG